MEHYDSVEAYFNGELTASQKKAMEARLSEDEALNETFQAYKAAMMAVDTMSYEFLKRSSSFVEADENPRVVKRLPFFIAAASVIFIISCSLLWINTTYSDKALFAENAVVFNFSIERSGEKGYWDELVLNYQDKKYDLLLEKIEDTYRDKVIHEDIGLLKTVTFLNSGHLEKAEKEIDRLRLTNNLRDNYNADWLKILLLLKRNETLELKMLLEQIIINPDHPYADKAKVLKSRLGSFWRKLSF